MIRIICVLFVAALVSASPERKPHYDINDAPALFEKFIKDYNKHYKDAADREVHYKAFVNTLEKINKWNSVGSSSTADINQFTDITPEEFDNMNGVPTVRPTV
ncbi:unnamed protein product [Pieris brassicae]|uniref:Cathepsin propeptide inhibitor domain-containing protein n=1 Tax=Pieris brassicae TaxID=7116 RepID=A0A9P0SJ69_PIEBR|nr:unnamed protein product [Pieris brassicae]